MRIMLKPLSVFETCWNVTDRSSWSSDMNLGPYAPFSSLGETRCISEIYLAEKAEKECYSKGWTCVRSGDEEEWK